MTITVANFITQYLRPSLASAADYSDATLGYWIDAALIDISRSFPRKAYATWTTIAATQFYPYADSLTIADETTIIRVLDCLYPYTAATVSGPPMSRKNHLDDDFYGGDYYDPDNDAQVIYIGKSVTGAQTIYCDCHIIWKTATNVIINPPEHHELIRLFTIWQAYLHQTADVANLAVPDSALLNALALQAGRAETAYHTLYDKLDQAKASSGITQGWSLDKWDPNSRNTPSLPGSVPPGHTFGEG